MTIESSFIPFPSEVVVPPAAYLAAAGEMNFFLVVLSATAGALLGALINYGLSIWIGRAIVYKFVNSRLGHALLLDEQKMIKAESYFVRYGNVSTLIGRLVPAVRQLISIPPDWPGCRWAFCTVHIAGGMCWNTILAVIGIPCTVWCQGPAYGKGTCLYFQISWVLLAWAFWRSDTLSGK